ncbi:expressed unknown protein (Partial), partial [Seminavis robusta]
KSAATNSQRLALASASSRNSVARRRIPQKKHFSDSSPSKPPTAAEIATEKEAARQQVLHEANETMKSYHHARLAKLRGELPSRNKTGPSTNYVQIGVVVAFMAAFCASPFLGKRIAQDKEFREKYVPSWYDFTIKKPTSELSREEVHDQILQLQKEIRARAIAGDFSDEKLSKMRRYMEGLDPEQNKEFNPDNDQHAWSKLHPGLDDDEDVEDE